MADSPSTTRSDSPLPGNAVILSLLFGTCHTVKVSPVSCAVWCGFPVNLPFPCHNVKVSPVSCAVWCAFPVNLPFLYHTVKVSPTSCAVWYRNHAIFLFCWFLLQSSEKINFSVFCVFFLLVFFNDISCDL